MKKIFLGIFAAVCFLGGLSVVKAEGEVSIDLKIYQNGEAIFNDSILFTPCLLPSAVEGDLPEANTYCAVEQSGVNTTWSQFGSDFYLDSVNGFSTDFSQNLYWAVFYDLEYASDSMSAHILSDGEEIILAYNSYPLKIEGDSSPLFNENSVFTVYQFGLDESFNPTWSPYFGATVFLDGENIATTGENGEITLLIDFTEEKKLTASAQNATPSAAFDIEADFPEKLVDLIVVTNTETIFDGEVSVLPCGNEENGGELTYNAYCALLSVTEGQDFVVDEIWSDFGVFINGVNSYSSDFDNSLFWLTFLNRDPMSVSLNNQIIENGDEIILAYNTSPLKISVSNSNPSVGDIVDVYAEIFNVNTWSYDIALNAIFTINGAPSLPEIDGVYNLLIESDEPYVVSVSVPLYLQSPEIFIEGSPVFVEEECGDCSSGGGGTEENVFNVDQAVSFLLSNQEEDGSFGADLYTDWVALALASNGNISNSLKDYLISDTNPGSLFQDILRRAMALLAFDINPYNDTSRNYITDILEEFDGTQFGDNDIYNDDLFALLVLYKSGFDSNREEIKKVVEFVLLNQDESGAFLGVDITSASIQILSLFSDLPGVSNAIENAKTYLHDTQNEDGGFGNSFATSWTLQAIGEMGDMMSAWEKNNNTPLDFLTSLQESDGGVEPLGASIQNRIWATAYAIPGALQKPWGEILESFDLEEGDILNITEENNGTNNISEEEIIPKVLGDFVEAQKNEVPVFFEPKPAVKVLKNNISNVESGEVLGVDDGKILDPTIHPVVDLLDNKKSSSVVWLIFGIVILGAIFLFRKK